MSVIKVWVTLLLSLLDELAVLGAIFLGLWFFKVKITWAVVLVVLVVVGLFGFIVHRALIPSLLKRKLTGAEGMIGMVGTVIEPLRPVGSVKVKDEYWKASSADGEIGAGEEVEVVAVKGLNLEVRKKLS